MYSNIRQNNYRRSFSVEIFLLSTMPTSLYLSHDYFGVTFAASVQLLVSKQQLRNLHQNLVSNF